MKVVKHANHAGQLLLCVYHVSMLHGSKKLQKKKKEQKQTNKQKTFY